MIELSAEEVVTAFQNDWPTQYEISVLRLVNRKQSDELTVMRQREDARGVPETPAEPARVLPASIPRA